MIIFNSYAGNDAPFIECCVATHTQTYTVLPFSTDTPVMRLTASAALESPDRDIWEPLTPS